MSTPNQNKGPVTQFVPVTVAQGIETKIDPNLVAPPKGLVADNVRLTTLGATRKRYGMQLLPSAGSGNVNIGTTNKQLISTSNNQVQAFDFDDNVWVPGQPNAALNAVYSNAITSLPLGTQSTYPSNTGMQNPSIAVIGDIGIFCYDFQVAGVTPTDQLNITCFDIYSGQIFWNRQFSAAVRNVGSAGYYLLNHGSSTPTISSPFGLHNSQVIAYGNQFILTFCESGVLSSSSYGSNGSLLRAFAFSPSRTVVPNLATSANCTQIDNFAFPTYWSTTSYSTTGTYPALYYCANKNATDYTIAIHGANRGSDTNSQIVAVTTNTQPVAQTSAFNKLYQTVTNGQTAMSAIMCGMAEGLNLAVMMINSGAYIVPTATGGAGGFSSFTAWNMTLVPMAGYPPKLFDIRVKATSTTSFTYTATDGAIILSGSGTASTLTQSANSSIQLLMASQGQTSLASRIVTYNGDPCAWIIVGDVSGVSPTEYQSLLFVDLNPALYYNVVVARAFYLQTTFAFGSRPANAFLLNGNPTTVLLQLAQDSADQLQFPRLVSVVPSANQIIPVPDGALITGADTKYYDNSIVRSAGWLKIPELPYNATTQTYGIMGTTGGGLVSGQTYSYILVLADFDAAGNAIYSVPSPAYSIALTSSQNAVSLSIANIWSSFLPSSTGPVLFIYRTSNADNINYHLAASLYVSAGTPNTWVDLSTDKQFASAPYLYSQPSGGEQPNDPAPPSSCGVATKTRVFLAGAERGSALYFSKPFFYGRAPEFNYGNVLDIEPSTGPIIGLGAIDEVVVIFKRSAIYLLSGTGPDATGQGVFSAIANISTDRGLVDSKSIALSNDGLYFRSQRGIELLDRSYNLNYIGQSVEQLVNGNSVVSALSVPSESQVRFALSNGKTLVYDYTAQGWTTYSYTLNSITGTPVANTQTLFGNVPFAAVNGSSGGQVYQESAQFLDESSLYPYTIQTAHMPLAGPQGWGRIRRANILGVTATIPSQFSVTFVYDYGAVTSPPIIYNIAQPGAFNIRVRAPRQVAQAVSVIVQNVTASGTGEGSYITGIVFETSQKSGALRIADTQSV